MSDRRGELCALIATTPLSPRTLLLLAAVVLEEERLALIGYGSLTVALHPEQIRLSVYEERARVRVDGRPVRVGPARPDGRAPEDH